MSLLLILTIDHQQNGLMVACCKGFVNIVYGLHSCPFIDINHQDNEGNTALMIASQAGKSHLQTKHLQKKTGPTSDGEGATQTSKMLQLRFYFPVALCSMCMISENISNKYFTLIFMQTVPTNILRLESCEFRFCEPLVRSLKYDTFPD